MDKSSFQRIIDEIVKKTSVESIKAELQRVREDIRSISEHPQAKRAKKEAEKRSKKLFRMINDAQKQFDAEVEKAVTRLRQSTSDIETTIHGYRAKAAKEFSRLEDIIGKRVGNGANAASTKTSTSKKKKKTTGKKKATKKSAAAGSSKKTTKTKKKATSANNKKSGKKKSS